MFEAKIGVFGLIRLHKLLPNLQCLFNYSLSIPMYSYMVRSVSVSGILIALVRARAILILRRTLACRASLVRPFTAVGEILN